MERVESKGRTPWAVKATFKGFAADYPTLRYALDELAGDLARKVGRSKLARVKVWYDGPENRGRRPRVQRDWTVGEIAPLDTTLHRASRKLRDAWVKYGEGTKAPASARRLEIWLSSADANDTGEF